MVDPLKRLTNIQLSRRDRLVTYYLTGLAALIVVYTVTYNFALAQLEGVNQSIFASFEFIVQTMTTTGYGQDSGIWSHPLMFLFVAATQISGIALGFFTLRLIIIPLFTGAEVNLDNRLTSKQDHVIICEYRRDSAVLLDELRELGIEYVLISSSEEHAKELADDGYSVIDGSPQDTSAFERASIDSARAVITDAGDANVNTILTVRSIDPDIEIITLTDDSDMRDILLDTGADTVLSPHGVLGRRLAEKAISSFSSDLTDTIDIGGEIEVTEVPVQQGNRLIGTRIRDSKIREETGANIIGAWIDGELQLPPHPDAIIRSNTVLLVTGAHDALEAFSDFTQPARTLRKHERIIVAGQGEVGQAARDVVSERGLDTVTIDIEDRDGVDVVGDSGSDEILAEAGIESAGAIIIGLPDDSAALLTTVLARSLNQDIEILVRVSDTDATRKALSAGADYVLSVPRVSARMVARELRGEDVLAPASQIRLLRVPATPLVGSTLAKSGIYEKTGCRVIAIEDESGFTSAVDPQRKFTGTEHIVLVGSDESVQQFRKQFDVSPIKS
ncbi:TrkA family potassium uptake protein [Haloarcula hispanica]|jgi:Trk K+ transport system NAD-binding subunit|uniref:TrkA family potassium uptake protein n=1 Tax=Haloarcula hispanica TaxID=51589 RepID=A0A5J5LCS8_HALHI|nr:MULTISPECIES: NAD-binding protein [unclassified Haloarcula]AJF27839.1 potassium transporter TrkA [Haloarcula sp. CBA1115]KAA9404666.1 TrkA family potassium uptake protein [Haloarcula hispanica]